MNDMNLFMLLAAPVLIMILGILLLIEVIRFSRLLEKHHPAQFPPYRKMKSLKVFMKRLSKEGELTFRTPSYIKNGFVIKKVIEFRVIYWLSVIGLLCSLAFTFSNIF